MKRSLDARWLLALVVAARLALGLAYAAVVPPWEAHDETGHYAFVAYVAANRALPPPGATLTPWFDETHQPPLYYLLAGLIGSSLAPPDPPRPEINPFFLRGDGAGGVNAVLHDPAAEAFSYQVHVLPLRLARVVSVLVSTAAVVVAYGVARVVVPGRPGIAVAGAAFAAFVPTAVFLGSSVNNDALIPLTGGLVLLVGLKVASECGDWRGALPLGLALGLALLTKNSALAFVPFAGLALALGLWRAKAPLRTWVVASGAAGFALAGTAGWWYLHNWLATGRPLVDRDPTNVILETIDPLFESLGKRTPQAFAVELLDNTFRSSWALFGWGNVPAPDWFYAAAAALSLAALAGLALGFLPLRPPAPPPGGAGGWEVRTGGQALLLAFVALAVALPLYRALFFNTPTLLPGRYLLSASTAIGPLMALGLAALLPDRVRALGLGAISMGLIGAAAALLPLTIVPAYAPPPLLTESEVQASASPLAVTFDRKLAIEGYQIEPTTIRPGETVAVTLYWQALAPMAENYTVGVHVVDSQLRSLGQLDRHPGRGNYPTSRWRPGDRFAETFRIRVSEAAAAPALARVLVGVQRFHADPPGSDRFRSFGSLPALDPTGTPITPVFGEIKLLGSTPPPPGLAPVQYRLGDQIELAGYALAPREARPGERLQLDLLWQTTGPVDGRYVVFAHVLNGASRVVAQQDSEPRGGSYPTFLWGAGERIPDRYDLALPADLPPGEYVVQVGMYRRDDLKRLPVMDAAGQPVPDDRIILAKLRVGA